MFTEAHVAHNTKKQHKHTHTHTHINTYPPTRLYTHLHIKDALMCTQRCAHLHTCKHVHTNICTRKHAYMHTHADTSKFACTNMYKHIVTHMHTCTCTPTHIRARVKDVMLLMCECLNEQWGKTGLKQTQREEAYCGGWGRAVTSWGCGSPPAQWQLFFLHFHCITTIYSYRKNRKITPGLSSIPASTSLKPFKSHLKIVVNNI